MQVVEEKVEEEVEDGGDQVPEYDYEPLPPEEDRLYKPFFMTQGKALLQQQQ